MHIQSLLFLVGGVILLVSILSSNSLVKQILMAVIFRTSSLKTFLIFLSTACTSESDRSKIDLNVNARMRTEIGLRSI